MKKIILLLLIISVYSCKKTSRCETWKFYDQCVPKNNLVIGCGTGPINYLQGPFCGDDLTGISAGSTKIIHEDGDAKIVRHFIQKVN